MKNFQDDVFIIYQDEPLIIVYKHQNVQAEVNLDYAIKNKIKTVRRFSGEGTVIQDLANLNFTFIGTGNSLDFSKFTRQTIYMHSELGIKAVADEGRALNTNSLKISGSAQCVQKTE